MKGRSVQRRVERRENRKKSRLGKGRREIKDVKVSKRREGGEKKTRQKK